MILADKIARLRKKNGWSQEELAAKVNVSRQAVSKWESAQTVPDLEKILLLGQLFDVTTDYLLKDEIENEEFTGSHTEPGLRRVTLAEANEYLSQRKAASGRIAIATFLCILSPIPLILLSTAIDLFSFSENLAVAAGLVALFVLVAAAVAIYIFCGFRNAPYQFLEKESFETEYGVRGMVQEKQKHYRGTYVTLNIIATCLCVLCPIPLLVGALSENDFLVVSMLTVTMFLAGIGVMLFIIAGVRWASMQRLLKEGEFTDRERKKSKLKEAIDTIYWLLATAIYLGWSFYTGSWHITWVVWPIAGILSAVLSVICNLCLDKDE